MTDYINAFEKITRTIMWVAAAGAFYHTTQFVVHLDSLLKAVPGLLP